MYKNITVILCVLILCSVSLPAAVSSRIGPDNLLAHKSPEPPRKSFALNGDLIQIKLKNSSLLAAWAGHNIVPSDNTISFTAGSLNGKNAAFVIKIRMTLYHADSREMCGGRSKSKWFRFGDYTRSGSREFHMPLTIRESDLQCTQCGRLLKHGGFIFYFEVNEPGGIEVSQFDLQTAFPVRLQAKKDAQSAYLSNVLTGDWKPYEKKMPEVSRLSQDVLTLSQRMSAIRKQYGVFRAVLELLQKKDYKNAVVQAEKIGKENMFCSMMLYLVYSRGYYDTPRDYPRAAEYFNTLIGSYIRREPGFMFWQYEYNNIWAKYRMIPTKPNEKVMLKSWDNTGRVMDEIMPLRGTYPLENCYEERMQNIGGVGARVLYLVSREQSTLKNILEEARKLGNAEAWAGTVAHFIQRTSDPESRAVVNKPNAEEFKNLIRASELGYIPAKLHLAKIFITENYSPQGYDLAAARKLLRESIEECGKYQAAGCKHAEADLKYARELLSYIPQENTPTAELLKLYDQLQSQRNNNQYAFQQFRLNIIAEMISQRTDSPDALFMQAIKLPSSQYKEKQRLLLSAAEKGSRRAVMVCLNTFSRHDPNYWYFLVLAGKHKLPYNGSQQNYFNEAYMLSRQMRYQMPPAEYLKILEKLSPYHKHAKTEYDILSRDLKFDITVSDKATVSAVKINNGGLQFIEIKAQPSPDKRCITIKNRSVEKIRGEFFLFSSSPQCSNYDVRCEFTGENNRIQSTYPGNSVMMQYLPEELKVFIAPRQVPLELQIRFMLR